MEPSIDFTYEIEEEVKLAFMDTEITHHPDGTLSTTVYRKSTHTDKYLYFNSYHRIAHKLAVVKPNLECLPGTGCLKTLQPCVPLPETTGSPFTTTILRYHPLLLQ